MGFVPANMNITRYLRACVAMVFIASAGVHAQGFESSDLPIFIIDTHGMSIPDEPKIVGDLGVIYNGPGQRNNTTDTFNHYSGKLAIEIRGSSSQMFPKKQFGFELLGPDGQEIEAPLLGFPPESDWILFAPYNDKSLMRDVLAYKLANDMGRYAPRARFCELVLNGQYEGVYVLLEKIKRDVNRVNIEKLAPDETSGGDLTGGYIIKIDKQTADWDQGWFSDYPPPGRSGVQLVNFLHEYPDPKVISSEQRQYIRNFMEDFEGNLKSEAYADPLDGYASYIDVPSFIDFFIINEISRNVDGYRLSTFLHKHSSADGGKLVMGPVWDFNLGFGNADYCEGWSTQGLARSFNQICPGDYWLVPFWWDRLFQDPAFSKKVKIRWQELRADTFSDQAMLTYVDSLASALSESSQRNFNRWPVLGSYVWPNYFIGNTFEQEVEWLKQWIVARTAWMDAYIGNLVTHVEPDEQWMLVVYPNPSPGNGFQFKCRSQVSGQLRIEIFDVTGRKVETAHTFAVLPEEISLRIGISLTAGTYFYKAYFDDRLSAVGKLMTR